MSMHLAILVLQLILASFHFMDAILAIISHLKAFL